MKTITINFKRWSCGGTFGGVLSRTYNRFYFLGHIWTPFVVVKWRIFKK